MAVARKGRLFGVGVVRPAAVGVALVSFVLALCAGPASALETHPFLFGFSTGGVGVGGEDVGGIAVDQSNGDVYVGDIQAHLVRRFDSSGGPANFSALGTNVLSNVSGQSVAVDPTNGNVYVTAGDSSIARFNSLGEPANFTAGSAAGTNVLSGDETPTGRFSSYSLSLTVDSSGSLFVSQNLEPGVIDRFSSSGAYAGFEISDPALQSPGGIAVDSSGAIYDSESQSKEVVKFDSLGSVVATIGTDGKGAGGLAVDPTSDTLYVGYETAFAQFSSSGAAEGEFGAGQIRGATGIAVNSAVVPDSADGRVYVHDRRRKSVEVFGPLVLVPDVTTGAASRAPSAITVSGTVNTAGTEPADALTDCHFEYVTKAAFEADSGDGFSDLSSGGSVSCASVDGNPIANPGEIPDDASDHVVAATITSLLPSTNYRFRLVAANSNGPNRAAAQEFTTAGPPTISAVFASDVSSTAATIGAEANPRFLASTYRFEYVDDATYRSDVESAGPGHGFDHAAGVPLFGGALGSGAAEVRVSAHLAGLSPGTSYHYRVVVENQAGSQTSAEPTFVTQFSGLGFELPDSRAWEMVSPPHKFGGSIVLYSINIVQAAAGGNGIAYQSLGSIEADPEGSRALEKATVLARRDANGWHSRDLTPPHTQAAGVHLGGEYKLFTPDLAGAVLEARDSTPLSPQASERTPYLRSNSEPATYTPLVTSNNVPAGTEFGGDETVTGRSPVSVKGANPALTHIVLDSTPPLVAGAAPGSLYEWAGGQLHPVSVLPAGEGGAVVKAELGSGKGSVRGAVSDDGSRVFWSSGVEYASTGIGLTGLYVRDADRHETGRLDLLQPGASGSGPNRPAFQEANDDGTTVFFTDSQQLTADASPDGRDLYRCGIGLVGGVLGCASLTDISAPIAGSGESTEMKDVVSALSDDGTRVYFVATGVLDTAANRAGDSAVSGQPNLYLWQEGAGTRFIARLSEEDGPDWGRGRVNDLVGFTSLLSAASSPDGRYFSFMSERSLTGLDNRDAASGEAVEEVFRYDASADRLDCVSCNPTGAGAVGEQQPPEGSGIVSRDPQRLWSGRWVAAMLPEASESEEGAPSAPSLYRARAVLDNGRVFFNAIDSLVPGDSNGQWDVYQYEPTGLGGCSASSGGAAIARSTGGCVSLISSGTAEGEASFLDASESGDDVFFLTPSRLSVTDEDGAVDVYDARAGGTPATLSPDTDCLGEACQPPPLAPNDATPASSTFKGAGNLKPKAPKRCAKGRHQVRRNGKVRCVAQKKRKHKKQARRAGQSGRAGR